MIHFVLSDWRTARRVKESLLFWCRVACLIYFVFRPAECVRDVGHGWFSSYLVPGTYYLVAADGWLHVLSTYFTLFSFFRGGRMSAPPTAVVGRLWSVFGGRAVTYGLYVQFLGYYGMMMC